MKQEEDNIIEYQPSEDFIKEYREREEREEAHLKEIRARGGSKIEEDIEIIILYYTPLLITLDTIGPKLSEEKVWEENFEDLTQTLREIVDSWRSVQREYTNPETSEERKKEIEYSVREWHANFRLLGEYNLNLNGGHWDSNNVKIPPYRIVIDPETGEERKSEDNTYLWGDYFFVPGEGILKIPETREALEELRVLSNLPPREQTNLPKDLVRSSFESEGDILEIGSEKDKKIIENLQKKGKLLFGSLEGLSGGAPYFKAVTIALAKILNEQSQYYHSQEERDNKGGYLLEGIPRERVTALFGDKVTFQESNTFKKEEREFPYIIVSYERLAKEMSSTGKIRGGRDIDFVRRYINGGYTKFRTDPKTGRKVPVKSSYTPGLTEKKYPIYYGDTEEKGKVKRGGYLYVPFVVNEAEIVDPTKKDPEVGCLLRLSPQYYKSVKGYTALRGDTIQLIGGGGKQKEITMDLLLLLAHSRGVGPTLEKYKEDILSRYAEKPSYKDLKTGKRRSSKLEAHWREAIQKCKEAKIIVDYKERKSPGGRILCTFIFNKDYLKGEELPLFENYSEG